MDNGREKDKYREKEKEKNKPASSEKLRKKSNNIILKWKYKLEMGVLIPSLK